METNPIILNNAVVGESEDGVTHVLDTENVSRETREEIEVSSFDSEVTNEEITQNALAIGNENEMLIDLASQAQGEAKSRSKASVVATMLLAAGMGLGLAHTEEASAHDQGNILQVFGDQVKRGVNQQVYEAGRDSGGVMGGAMRIMIDRTVNAATVRVLEGAGVPTVRAPEQVVVVPRSVEYGGGAYPQQRYPSYGEVRYNGGAVVRAGNEGGYDTQMVNQMRDVEARYATEKSRLMIEINSNPEQLQAVKEQQELNLMRLNKSFKDRVDRAQPDEKIIVMKEWSAAKSQLFATQRTEGPQGRLSQLEKQRAQDIAAIQIQAGRRAQGNY